MKAQMEGVALRTLKADNERLTAANAALHAAMIEVRLLLCDAPKVRETWNAQCLEWLTRNAVAGSALTEKNR